MKVKRKPVEMDAWKVADLIKQATTAFDDQPAPIKEAYDRGAIIYGADHMLVMTNNGMVKAEMDDWMMMGVQGELYPCQPDIFAETYEEA